MENFSILVLLYVLMEMYCQNWDRTHRWPAQWRTPLSQEEIAREERNRRIPKARKSLFAERKKIGGGGPLRGASRGGATGSQQPPRPKPYDRQEKDPLFDL